MSHLLLLRKNWFKWSMETTPEWLKFTKETKSPCPSWSKVEYFFFFRILCRLQYSRYAGIQGQSPAPASIAFSSLRVHDIFRRYGHALRSCYAYFASSGNTSSLLKENSLLHWPCNWSLDETVYPIWILILVSFLMVKLSLCNYHWEEKLDIWINARKSGEPEY